MDQATKKRHQAVDTEAAAAIPRVNGYEIQGQVGAGGMAVVWRARQTSLDRLVAIKVLRPEFAADPDEVRLFLEEARAAARIRHPNIVQVHDTGSDGGVYYFVMEYIAGPSVGRLLRAQGALPVKKALSIAKAVVEALDEAWKKAGIVHRDVKPDNIMIDEDDVVKVTDLGLAKVMRGHRASEALPAAIEGTPNYMAPEQVAGMDPDVRSDIYAMGATIYHMVTGKLPFADCSAAEAMQAQVALTLPNPRDINPRLPLGLSQLLTRMMMKQAADRAADWSEVLRDIKRVMAGRTLLQTPGPNRKSTIAPPVQRAVERTPIPAASAARVADPPSPGKAFRLLVLVLIWVGYAFWLMWPFAHDLRSGPRGLPAVEAQRRNEGRPPPGDVPAATGRPSSAGGQAATDARRAQREQEDIELGDQKLSLVARDVVFYLLRGRYQDAADVLERTRNEPQWAMIDDALREMEGLVRVASGMPQRILESFRRQAGQTITLHHGDRDLTVVVGAVTEQGVELRETGEAGRSVVVPVGQLDSRERLRRMGRPDDAATALMHTLLLLEAGNAEAARTMAARCGVLSEALIRQAERR